MKQRWVYDGRHDIPAELERGDQYDESYKNKKYRIYQKLEFADQPYHSLPLFLSEGRAF
jgi:hypothetical protein